MSKLYDINILWIGVPVLYYIYLIPIAADGILCVFNSKLKYISNEKWIFIFGRAK